MTRLTPTFVVSPLQGEQVYVVPVWYLTPAVILIGVLLILSILCVSMLIENRWYRTSRHKPRDGERVLVVVEGSVETFTYHTDGGTLPDEIAPYWRRFPRPPRGSQGRILG